MVDNSLRSFVPKPVSRYFRLDWQYALRVARMPILRPASLTIAVMPILRQLSPFLATSLQNVWLVWCASVSFLLGLALLKARAPAFIQEYLSYEQFRQRGHSHRWIVWEFYNALPALSDSDHIVRETVAKQLSIPVNDCTDFDTSQQWPNSPPPDGEEVQVFVPINVNRDIYLPMRIDNQQFVLAMREADPQVEAKERELFWILFTECAKARPIERGVVWLLFAIAGLLFSLSIVINVFRAIL
jgi:hypothetical protein